MIHSANCLVFLLHYFGTSYPVPATASAASSSAYRSVVAPQRRVWVDPVRQRHYTCLSVTGTSLLGALQPVLHAVAGGKESAYIT